MPRESTVGVIATTRILGMILIVADYICPLLQALWPWKLSLYYKKPVVLTSIAKGCAEKMWKRWRNSNLQEKYCLQKGQIIYQRSAKRSKMSSENIILKLHQIHILIDFRNDLIKKDSIKVHMYHWRWFSHQIYIFVISV